MIVGNGMIAKAFTKYIDIRDVIIFASGVSNSLETNENSFQREENLLRDCIKDSPDKTLVYFSTTSIYDSSINKSPYVKHKLKMEKILSDKAGPYNIFRSSQVVGKTNSPTIVKYLFDRIQSGKQFELWINSVRNLIDIYDYFITIDYIITRKLFRNEIVNIASPINTPVLEIVHIIESILNKKGNYTKIKKGAEYTLELNKCVEIYNQVGVKFHENYIKDIIVKYFQL